MRYPATIDLRVGGAYHVDFSRTNQGELDGVIVRVEPEKALAYVWGRSVLEWLIEPDGDGCRYTFRDHGTDAPADADDYTSAGIASGWHSWIDMLDAHLDGRVITVAEEQANWEKLKAPYQERLDSALVGVETRP
jgi:uncharacterized protein YndB with AHSA1/START domain